MRRSRVNAKRGSGKKGRDWKKEKRFEEKKTRGGFLKPQWSAEKRRSRMVVRGARKMFVRRCRKGSTVGLGGKEVSLERERRVGSRSKTVVSSVGEGETKVRVQLYNCFPSGGVNLNWYRPTTGSLGFCACWPS